MHRLIETVSVNLTSSSTYSSTHQHTHPKTHSSTHLSTNSQTNSILFELIYSPTLPLTYNFHSLIKILTIQVTQPLIDTPDSSFINEFTHQLTFSFPHSLLIHFIHQLTYQLTLTKSHAKSHILLLITYRFTHSSTQ